MEKLVVNRCISRNEGEHRRHIRLNHPRALCDCTKTYLLAANHHLRGTRLGVGIRRDNGVARTDTAVRRKCSNCGFQSRLHLVHRKIYANHTR